MRITIVGIGYVGAVSAACLAAKGHRVCAVDINPQKVQTLNEGKSPIVEPGLEEKISLATRSGMLRATSNLEESLLDCDLCFVAVATPSRGNGQIDPSHLFRACTQIAHAVAAAYRHQTVVIRSSVLPTIYAQCCNIFETHAPGLIDPGVNPEFLREGTAISDFEDPPMTIFGGDKECTRTLLSMIYADLHSPLLVLPPPEALMVKYASNIFHAIKVAFANEIGAVCRASGIDAETVMSAFRKDTVLNISPRYLKPGFAFGGSCLPKDLRAVLYSGRQLDIDLPLMRGILKSNAVIVERAVNTILETRVRRVGLVGLSFKSNTDDLRESPFVEVAERLLGKGIDLTIYDPNVFLAKLTGENKAYIDSVLPYLSRLLVPSLEQLVEKSDLLVLGHHFAELVELPVLLTHDCMVLDLGDLRLTTERYPREAPCYPAIELRTAS